MARYARKVVELMESWIGRNEYDGSHKHIIDIYNRQPKLPRGYKVKYSDAWCATCVSAAFLDLGYTALIPMECSCQKMIEGAMKMGIFVERDDYVPAPGDIIMYDWQDSGAGDNKGYADHVGIVENVVRGKITVIEGNYSNAVKRRLLNVDGQYIRGYICPKYDLEAPVKPDKTIEAVAKEVIRGKWGNGADRKKRLTDAGYDYATVQKMVNELIR